MSLLHLAILSPLLLAIAIPLLYKYFRQIHTGWFVLPLPIVLFIYFLQYISLTREGSAMIKSIAWIPSLDINFSTKIDGLGLLFALLITGIGSLIVLYSIYYLSKDKEKLNTFYVYLLLFIGAMLGVVLSDNLIVLYAFWELTSFSSFLLIGYWHHREKSRYGAQKSMLITVFGGLAMLGGFLLLYIMTGTFSITEIISHSDQIFTHSLFVPALLCVLLGAFTKSAQFPFHIWLPDAMEAPTPVSAYLHSATMVKAGIYVVARFSPIFAEDSLWLSLVAGFGIVTMFWGAFSAVKQTDLKAILAFSTVSQLGMIMSLLGVGAAAIHFEEIDNSYFTVATTAAVFHLINHATFKGSLFMVVGIIDHETGTRDIRKLGGLISLMPISFTIALIGAFSMAGLPPFNGFLSKEMFFTGMLGVAEMNILNLDTWSALFPIIAWVGSIFTFVYSMIIVFKSFTGKYQPEKLDRKPHEAPFGMLIPPLVLAALVIIFGIFPNILSETLIAPAMMSILPGFSFDVHISFWHGPKPELFMTLGVAVIGTILYLTLAKWRGVYGLLPEKLALNRFYDEGLEKAQYGSFRLTSTYMNGFIHTYLVYIFTFFIVILGTTLFVKDALSIDTANVAPVRFYEVILALIVAVSAISILFAKSRLTSIILLGAVGYTVALLFVVFRAPDLALTQLVIETVSVALFLLCFYHLPEISRSEERIRFRMTNAVISIGIGAIVTLIALSAHSTKLFDSIAHYYVENTYEEAAGKNMVNVILVDFRGFDTMFEITVLGIAALGIFTMIKLRLARRKEG
ncbi:Na+/H+ antiporter subunit A [Bacillus canaveralius]|uniref:Na+/H+ antiporter subunit A n=1 Tax=Bacillus canaveralius TaxID=1403243 RepID=A0A2N5GLT7_9BACI|nr:Na+/H+ antiporter subunit A [Bacillus canaveralius]PLR82826.1 Na+/H+ antiporter subunit A [Bacillus canaveralius]PLR97169.1 Na+/H+ antiporter subunit A [Bacillus canaveralius]RSK49776.1 Na+/H+ antiporter subunit A [Bacillus canaveralius]